MSTGLASWRSAFWQEESFGKGWRAGGVQHAQLLQPAVYYYTLGSPVTLHQQSTACHVSCIPHQNDSITNDYKIQTAMSNLEQTWRQISNFTGAQTHLLLQKPKNLQDEMLLIHAHRHLIAKQVLLKSVDHSLSSLEGSFSSQALQTQYLAFTKARKGSVEELPKWDVIFKRWLELKYAQDVSDEQFLKRIISIECLSNQMMLTAFLNSIAEELLQLIINKHLKLAEIQQINFKSDPSIKVSFTNESLLSFLDIVLPKTLFNTIVKSPQLPEALRGNKQLEILYSNREAEFIIKQCPRFSIFLQTLFKIILSKSQQLVHKQERELMEAAFRYFYLHHQQKNHCAAEIFIQCFNAISQSVRFAMTEEFVLFLHVAIKIGKGKFVQLLLAKSNWLREISEKTSTKKVMGYKLEAINPFTSDLAERIHVKSGTSEIRYLECIQEHSLVFLRISVQNFDITIRISYEGDYVNQGPKVFNPIVFQKVETGLAETIIFPSRGVYKIEFDNTYSWVNGKTIDFQQVTLTPISFISNNPFPFIDSYYLNKSLNTVIPEHLIAVNYHQTTRVHVNRKDAFFSFIIEEKESKMYQYQTDNPLRFLEKLHQLSTSDRTYQFCIANKTVKDIQAVENFLKDIPANGSSTPPKKREKEEVLIEIPLKY